MKVILALLVAICFISGEATFTWDTTRNASLSNSNDFQYRATTYGVYSLLFWNIAWFGTFAAESVPNQVNVDAIWAACYVGTGSIPVSWIAHFDATANYNITPSSATNFITADVTAAGGFLGSGYLQIDELDTNGTVVKTINFAKDLIWTLDPTQGASGAANNLYWITYQGTQLGSSLVVKLSFATASVYGYLSSDWLGAFISPKTIESFLYVDGWTYASSSNSLRLKTAVATASALLNGNGQLSINSGNGNNQVNFGISPKVSVSGTPNNNVQVSAFTTADLNSTFSIAEFQAQIYAKYGSAAQAYIVYTTLPAGSQAILVDPTMNVGPQPAFVDSAVSCTFSLAIFLLLAIALIAL